MPDLHEVYRKILLNLQSGQYREAERQCLFEMGSRRSRDGRLLFYLGTAARMLNKPQAAKVAFDAALEIPELVKQDFDEYERLAIFYATHPAEYAAMCEKLQAKRYTAPMYNTNLTVNISSPPTAWPGSVIRPACHRQHSMCRRSMTLNYERVSIE